jgi:hypothetical protein
MFREDGTAGARYALMFVAPIGQAAFQYRASPNTNAAHLNNAADSNAMRWVRLSRKGTTFSGSYCDDGRTWNSLGSVSVPMAQSTLAGLALTAHNDNAINTAAFDLVCFVPATSIDGSLRVLNLSRSGTDVFDITPSVTGKNYQLQKATTLGSWQNVGTSQPVTGDLLTFYDAGGATGSRLFYRVNTAAGSASADAPASDTRQRTGLQNSRLTQ